MSNSGSKAPNTRENSSSRKGKGIVIHEGKQVRTQEVTDPPRKGKGKGKMGETTDLSSKDRHTNRLKVAGHRTIIEEKVLSVEGVKERYPKVWEMIKFHNFEVFTQPRDTYVPSMVREFYQALEAVIPKVRRELRTLN